MTQPSYRPAAKEELAKAPLVKVSAEEIRERIDYGRSALDKLQARWSLFLAVGNGAALTALGSKIIDVLAGEPTRTAKTLLALAFPSIWLFALGLVAAGVIPFFELLGMAEKVRLQRQSLRHVESGLGDSYEPDVSQWDSLWAWTPEILATLLFMAGLLWPLVRLTSRFFTPTGMNW